MGKKARPTMKDNPSEDSLTIKDVVSWAKDAKSKSKTDGLIPRLLIPRKIPSKTRPRILDVGFSFVALFLLSNSVASATACNIIYFKLMNELFLLFLGSLLSLLPFLLLLQMSLNYCCSISNQ